MRHFGDDAHLQGTLCFDASQELRHALVLSPTEVAPQVEFPRSNELSMLLGAVLIIIATIVGALLFYKGFGVYARKEVCPIDALHGCQLLYTRTGNQQVLVMLQCLADELLQSGIGVHLPPLHIGNGERIVLRSLREPFGQIKLRTCIVLAQLARSHTETSCHDEHIE